MSTCAVVRSFIESKTMEVQTSNVGFTSEVSDYLVVHTGPGVGAEFRADSAREQTVVALSDDVRVFNSSCPVPHHTTHTVALNRKIRAASTTLI